MMHDAWYFSIASLPQSAKQEITQYLNSVDTIYRAELDRICDFMNQGYSSDGTVMIDAIRQLDQRRNQDLSKVAPELAIIIGYEK
jgi:hypothetical protein